MDAEKARREALAAIGCDWRNHPAEHTAEKHLAVKAEMHAAHQKTMDAYKPKSEAKQS